MNDGKGPTQHFCEEIPSFPLAGRDVLDSRRRDGQGVLALYNSSKDMPLSGIEVCYRRSVGWVGENHIMSLLLQSRVSIWGRLLAQVLAKEIVQWDKETTIRRTMVPDAVSCCDQGNTGERKTMRQARPNSKASKATS